MIRNLRVTVLVDNVAGPRGLLAEHGLSFWIEADDRKILFDTGQGAALKPNAAALDIHLEQTNDVVLSHGHYDHTGGLESVLDALGHAHLYVHPAAFGSKHARNEDGSARDVGSSPETVGNLQGRIAGITLTDKPVFLAPGIQITGTIPRRNHFEDTGGAFFQDLACTVPDQLTDDQALLIETQSGLVVILGCTHSGVVNTLDYARELTGHDRIHAIAGGMHLVNAGPERIEQSMDALTRCDCSTIVPCHCTGFAATSAIFSRHPDRFALSTTGTRFTLAG